MELDLIDGWLDFGVLEECFEIGDRVVADSNAPEYTLAESRYSEHNIVLC
jgi:hypothetical protein